MERERDDALPEGHEFEGYRIEGVLGAGGFGITYRAADLEFGRTVAIKEYLPSNLAARADGTTVRPLGKSVREDFEYGLASFREEGLTLSAFRHQNIVPVYRFFEAHGTAYLVMGFVEGQTLASILSRRGRLDQDEIREVLDPVLGGLDRVHRAGFLHRDIKPSNIVVDTEGEPVLIDFGAARQALGDRTMTHTAIITAGYSPPEQYSSRGRHGPASDIYAVAATLYACVAGRPPPDAPDRLLGQGMTSAVEAGGRRYSKGLLQAIDAGLLLDADKRPQSVAAFRALMEGGEAGEPPTASRPRRRAKGASGPPMRAVGFGAAAAVLAVVAGAAAIYAPWRPAPELPAPDPTAGVAETPPPDTPASDEPIPETDPPEGVGESAPAPPANRPPEAADDTAETTAGEAVDIPVLANDRDPEGDTLRIEATDPGPPRVRVVGSGADARLRYAPPAGFTGSARIVYTVADEAGGRDEAAVVVTVTPAAVTPPPAAQTEQALGLSREDRVLVQRGLNDMGYAAGAPDGVFGAGTRAAIDEYQADQGLDRTGYLTRAQADLLIDRGRVAAPPPTAEDDDAEQDAPSATAAQPDEPETDPIEDLVAGKRASFQRESQTQGYLNSYAVDFEPGGTVRGQYNSTVASGNDTGRWWAENGKLCLEWSSWDRGQTICYDIAEGQRGTWLGQGPQGALLSRSFFLE